MESPLKQVRRDLGNLSAPTFAALCSISTATLYQVEHGTAGIPRKVELRLQELGFDVETLRREQAAYRELCMQQLLERLKKVVAQKQKVAR